MNPLSDEALEKKAILAMNDIQSIINPDKIIDVILEALKQVREEAAKIAEDWKSEVTSIRLSSGKKIAAAIRGGKGNYPFTASRN